MFSVNLLLELFFSQGTGNSSANTCKKQRELDAFREVEIKNRGI